MSMLVTLAALAGTLGLTANAPLAETMAGRFRTTADAMITAPGTVTDREGSTGAAEAVNVLAFGADPSGKTDSAPGIQAAMTWASSSQSRRRVFIPAGRYRIQSGLSFAHVRGVALVGAGSAATILQVSGVIHGAVLDLNGVNTSDFQGFTIECDTGVTGTSSFDIGIRYWWDLAHGASYNNTFRDIQIWGARFRTGIQVGSDLSRKSSGQEDQTYWYGVRVVGNTAQLPASWDSTWWQECIRVGSGVHGNNLLHQFHGFGASGCRYGVREAAGEALFSGGVVQSNSVDFFHSATGPASEYWTVRGVRSEGSGRLIGSGGSSSVFSQVSYENIEWIAEPGRAMSDRFVIDVQMKMGLVLKNVTLHTIDRAFHPRIRFRGPTLLVDGMNITNGKIGDIFSLDDGGTSNNAIIRGLNVLDMNGAMIDQERGIRIINGTGVEWSLGDSTPDVTVARGSEGRGHGSLSVSAPGGIKLNGNPVIPASSAGTIPLASGTGKVTVRAGATCVCTDSTANASVRCTVTAGTLTATGTGDDLISYVCF